VAFSKIFYAIPFHSHLEIPRPLYLPSHHMFISMSCTNPFVNFLECFFLLLSHPNILTMFHQTTSCITLLHRGNIPWLTFVGFSYLYWIPLRDISKVVYIVWYYNTMVPIYFSFDWAVMSHKISDFNIYGLYYVSIINFGYGS